MKIGEAMYKQQADAAGAAGAGAGHEAGHQAGGGAHKADDDVIDAEFKDVSGDKKH